MDLTDALEQIDVIHTHLARAETYRGYRPLAIAASGVAGLVAAMLQPWVVAADAPLEFVRYWVVIAIACAILSGGVTVLAYFTREDAYQRRQTRTVLGQFAPCLLVGAVLTMGLTRSGDPVVSCLPGAWALIYGLGIVASLPYLPRMIGAIAAWYLGWGLLLLSIDGTGVPGGWMVGLPFGLGQCLAAFVLTHFRKETTR